MDQHANGHKAPDHPSRLRRTFAIISHPDAGKTTLTEKILLFGGAITLAGEVKAKRNRISTRSDWMKIERERGISVATSVMTLEYRDHVFNLLDTPGHEDFSEDTYRTLTAVDAAIMVIDGAKGIEARTRKLFEVCRLRDIPILTFINKMDREARDPFDLLDEIEKTLALDTAPINWPMGQGKSFAGTFTLTTRSLRRVDDDSHATRYDSVDDPALLEHLPISERAAFRDSVELAMDACRPFDLTAFREGHLSPVFFGSALRNFGIRELMDAIVDWAPSPRDQQSAERVVTPEEPAMTGFIFKIQANMDPKHRDRIAFLRVCSGTLKRGMKARLIRTGKPIPLNAPQFFFAQDRSVADEAWAGDIVGIPNHGTLRIGDTLSEGEDLVFRGIPSFAPELLRRVVCKDAMRAKKLKEALYQMAEEGIIQVFAPLDGSPMLVGVVGALQLDVLSARLDAEYDLPVEFEMSRFSLVRWVTAKTEADLNEFTSRHYSAMAHDLDGALVFLAPNEFGLGYDLQRAPAVEASDVKDYQIAKGG